MHIFQLPHGSQHDYHPWFSIVILNAIMNGTAWSSKPVFLWNCYLFVSRQNTPWRFHRSIYFLALYIEGSTHRPIYPTWPHGDLSYYMRSLLCHYRRAISPPDNCIVRKLPYNWCSDILQNLDIHQKYKLLLWFNCWLNYFWYKLSK